MEDRGFEHGQELGLADGGEALFLEGFLEGGVLGDVADFVHDAEVEADGWETETVTVRGEGVEVGGGGSVSGLGRVAKDATCGGEEDEEVERVVEERIMKIEGPVDFGADGSFVV